MDRISLEANDDGSFGDQSGQIILYRHATSKANIIWDKNRYNPEVCKDLDR